MNNIFSSVKQMLAFETFNSIKIGTEREREREREKEREREREREGVGSKS